MSRFMIYPYKQASEGAIAIAKALDGQRILREGSKYSPRASDVIINWGASDCPFENALNASNGAVLNKLAFFNRLIGTGLTPPFAGTLAGATSLAFPVFCRTQLKGRDGAGIVVANNAAELVPCDLYVQGAVKTSEYRVHVGRKDIDDFTIIGVQQKFVDETLPGQDPRVWAGEGTRFVWTVNGNPVQLPASVMAVIKSAFAEFPELTFGAFDVIYDRVTAAAYVLEINTAPTMTPETTRRYAEFFRSFAVETPQAAAATAPTLQENPDELILLTVTVNPQSITAAQIQQTLGLMNGVTSVTVS